MLAQIFHFYHARDYEPDQMLIWNRPSRDWNESFQH